MRESDTRIELSHHVLHAGFPWALVITQMPFNFHSFCLGGIPVLFCRQAQYGRRCPSHKPVDASHNTPDTIHGVAAMQPCRKNREYPLQPSETPTTAFFFNHPSSWRHRRSGHGDQWSWCAGHEHGVPSSVADHGGPGSSSGARGHHGAWSRHRWRAPASPCRRQCRAVG